MADFDERIASLNTQMRFKRYSAALPIAYKLRLDLQLTAVVTEKVQLWRKDVDEVIEMLEKNKGSKFGRWLKLVARSVRDSFDPNSQEPEAPAPPKEGEEQAPPGEPAEPKTDEVTS